MKDIDLKSLYNDLYPSKERRRASAPSIFSQSFGSNVVDPNFLTLSGFMEAPFSSSPWTGKISLGTSGDGRTFFELTNPPTAGTTVDGFAPASFNGTNQRLADASIRSLNDYCSQIGYTYILLVKPSAPAVASASATPYLDQGLFASKENDILGLSWTTTGVRAWHYTGINWTPTALVPCSSGAWHMIAVTYDGVTLKVQVDNNASASLARIKGNSFTAISAGIGHGSFSGAFAAADYLGVYTALNPLQPEDLTGFYNYFKNKCPSAGLP